MTDKQQAGALVTPPALVRVIEPQALIAAAIDKGAGIETLERLVQLAKDVRQVTAREAFFQAVANFKAACPPIKKTKTADTGRYKYSYSPLDEVTSSVDPVLAKQGLSYRWEHPPATRQGYVASNCILTHVLGHQEPSGPVEIPYNSSDRMNQAQGVGSALTYSKRYSLLAILGLAPEDDDDARSTEGGGSSHTQGAPAVSVRRSPEPQPGAPDLLGLATEPPFGDEAPDADVERERPLNEIKRLANNIKLPAKERTDAWITYVGKDVTPSSADPAALHDLVKWLETRQPK